MSRTYRDQFEMIPPNEETVSHHLGCDENVCKVITIDLVTQDLYITCSSKGTSLTRVKITPEELNEMTTFIHMIATKELEKEVEDIPVKAVS